MKIIIAPDSFKGSISASDAARCIKEAVLEVDSAAHTVVMPVADGGEGTVDAVANCIPAKIRKITVTGPMGSPVTAGYAVTDGGKTAVIEMAQASGLTLVPPERRDPRFATTYGTGQLMKDALDTGCEKMIIGIGGSATNDGGAGALTALGASFERADGTRIGLGAAALSELDNIDLSAFDARIADTEVVVACDVTNPLTGPDGASRVYGPQKGATEETVRELDDALCRFAKVSEKALGEDYGKRKGAGAAGGLGFALMAYCKASFASGIDVILDICGFDEELKDADLVITGEGRIDGQSANGKVLYGIGQRAKRAGVPVIAFGGCVMLDGDALLDCGLTAMFGITNGPCSLDYSMEHGAELLKQSVRNVMRVFMR